MYTEEDTHIEGKLWVGPFISGKRGPCEGEAWIEVTDSLDDEHIHEQISEIHRMMNDDEIHRIVVRSKYGKSKAPMLGVAYACKYLGRNLEECLESVCESRITDIGLLDFFIVESFIEGSMI